MLGPLTPDPSPPEYRGRGESLVAHVGELLITSLGWPTQRDCTMTQRVIRRALLSVSDKTGLVDLAKALALFNVELISTGGTKKILADAGLSVRDVSDVTGFPEMMDGRVKTLHPLVHGGILARRSLPDDLAAAATHGITLIELVVVNLYPFVKAASNPATPFHALIE